MKHHEFDHQCALFRWARMKATVEKYPAIQLLEGSMNGVRLTVAQAGKSKAAGMLKGSHDITLPVARHGYGGLSIELKYGKNKPTPEQLWYGDMLKSEGWLVMYCWSWEETKFVIEEYLGERHPNQQ